MRHSGAGAKTIGVVLAAVVCSIAGLERQVCAQGRTNPVARRIEKMEKQVDQYERDGLHRDAEEKTGKATDWKRTKTTVAQVTEDFGRIQKIYNDLVLTLSSGKTLDQTLLSESVKGINRCAGRLKSNLALPQAKNKDKGEQKEVLIEEAPLKTSLTLLLNHISRFVTNPLFESSGVLDIELSNRASRDLEEIIHISDSIRKKAEKLK